MAKINLPFSWLGRYGQWLGATVVLVIAAVFRLLYLVMLPPGLTAAEANLGLAALKLAEQGRLPGFVPADGFSPLLAWMEGLAVKLLGHGLLALRLWPAMLGVAAVLATWLWARDWFGGRIAWVAGLLAAVTPWAVIL